MPNNPLLSGVDDEEDWAAQVALIEAAHAEANAKLQKDATKQAESISSQPEKDMSQALVLHPTVVADQAKPKDAKESPASILETLSAEASKSLVSRFAPASTAGSTSSSSSTASWSASSSSSSSTLLPAKGAFDARNLKVGQEIDAHDCNNTWLKARVIKVGAKKVLVNFKLWGDKWNEWYPIGSDRLADKDEHTGYAQTGPVQSNQHEFYQMSGANLTKFVTFITDTWQPFYQRFDQKAPSDADMAAGTPESKSFDVSTAITDDDYKMLYRENHDFIGKALQSFVDDPIQVSWLHDYLKQNVRLLFFIMRSKNCAQLKPILMEQILRIMDATSLSKDAAKHSVIKLLLQPLTGKSEKKSNSMADVSDGEEELDAEDEELQLNEKIQKDLLSIEKGHFYQKHGMGSVETEDDPLPGEEEIPEVIEADAVATEPNSPEESASNEQALQDQLVKNLDQLNLSTSPPSSSLNLSRQPSAVSSVQFAERPPPNPPKKANHKPLNEFSAFLIEYINYFGALGGFELIKQRLNESVSGVDAFQNYVSYLQLLVAISRFLTPDWRDILLPAVKVHSNLPAKLQNLTHEELKQVNKEQIGLSIIYARYLLAYYYHRKDLLVEADSLQLSPSDGASASLSPSSSVSTASTSAVSTSASHPTTIREWLISTALTLYLRLITSEVLERKIQGITDMSELVTLLRKAESEALLDDQLRQRELIHHSGTKKVVKKHKTVKITPKPTTPTQAQQLDEQGNWVSVTIHTPIKDEFELSDLDDSAEEVETPSMPEYKPSRALVIARGMSRHLIDWLLSHKVLAIIMGDASHEEILRRSSPIIAFLQAHKSLDFDRSILSLWNATAGKHENYVRVTYEIIAECVFELSIPQIDQLFSQVTSGLYQTVAPQGVSKSNLMSDFYLQFLRNFTVNAVRRTVSLAEDRLSRIIRGPPPGETEEMAKQVESNYFNTVPADYQPSIYGVKCFVDLLSNPGLNNGAVSPASPAVTSSPNSSTPLFVLTPELRALCSQLLPESLNAFPKSNVVLEPAEPDSTLLCPSNLTVASRILKESLTRLSSEPYSPPFCLTQIKLIQSVLEFFPAASNRSAFPVPHATNAAENKQYVVSKVLRQCTDLIQLFLHILTGECAFALSVKKSNPASIQANSDVMLPSGHLHTRMLHSIFDFFFPIFAADPHQDWQMKHVLTVWQHCVGPLQGETTSGDMVGYPVTVIDASISFYFLYRLIDADVQHFCFWSTNQNGTSSINPFESSNSNELRLRRTVPRIARSEEQRKEAAEAGFASDDDDEELGEFQSASNSAPLINENVKTGSDDETDHGVIPEADLEVEDFSDDEDTLNTRRAPDSHFLPHEVKLVLLQILFNSTLFQTPPVPLKLLNGPNAINFSGFSNVTGAESIQYLLLLRFFVLANEYAQAFTSCQFTPYLKLERFDGRLVGMEQLWNTVTGGNAPVSATVATASAIASSVLLSPTYTRELRPFLIDLYSRKYLSQSLVLSSSSGSSVSSQSDKLRSLIVAFNDKAMTKIQSVITRMEHDMETKHRITPILSQQLILLLQLLQEYFDADTRAQTGSLSLSSSNPFNTRPGLQATSFVNVVATNIFADKYFQILYDILQKFANESSSAASSNSKCLSANNPQKAPITELLFKLLMKLPQHNNNFVTKIIQFEFADSTAKPHNWDELFSSTGVVSLLFSLQIIIDFFEKNTATGATVDETAERRIVLNSWMEYFVHEGGLKHVVKIFNNLDLDSLQIFPPLPNPIPTGEEKSETAIAPSTNNSDIVQSKRCVNLLLQFLTKFLCDDDNFHPAYQTQNDDERYVGDLVAYSAQLHKLVDGCIRASQAYAIATAAATAAVNAASISGAPSTSSSSSSSSSTAPIGILSPSPSPSPAVSTVPPPPIGIEDTNILTYTLMLERALIVATPRTFMPAAMSEPSDSALLPLKFDATLYDRTFWRRLLVDGLLNQSVLPTRSKFEQGFEQILDSFREEQAGHPVQFRWFLMEIMSEIAMEPNAINWQVLFEQSNRGLEQFLEVFHMILQMEHTISNEKNPFENPFKIADTDCAFNPLALALHLLELFVARPIIEGPETSRPMSNDNTRYDKMGVWLLKLSTECMEILRKQGGAKWSRKIGKDAENFQELIGLDKQHGGKGIIQELYQSLYQLPAPTQLNHAPGSSVKPVLAQPHPRCKSFQSRSAAIALVRSIVGGNHATLAEFIRLMKGFQDSYLKNGVKEWEFKLPNDDTVAFGNDSAVPYQGIKNLGNTCYINALMQQLFTIPELRRNILRIELTPKDMPSADPKQSVVIQLQEIMSALQYGVRGSATTEGFCKSFKDWDGKPINPAIQDDSGLFFTRLVDKLNEDLKPTPYSNVIKQTLCGQLCNQLIGIDPNECTHSKSSYEEFTTLQLEIKNKKNLQQSLQAYVEGELLNGSNCFRCSICNKKVPTLKRTVVSKLPKTMSLMLKRFEMDYHSMTTNKINDFLEFPTRLNMKAFTLEGQQQQQHEQQERMKQQQTVNADSKQAESDDDEKASYHSTDAASSAANANPAPASASPAPSHPDEYYEYVLRGVVIHSGTVGAGHYYSYIQGRDDLNWYEMNDNRVSHFNFQKDFQTECFGGKESYGSAWNTGSNKSRSAYLLFYDRVKSELVIDPNQVAKNSFRVAAMALSFLARLKRKWNKSRQLLSPSAINAAESKGKVAALALQQASYNSMLKSLTDFLAYHPYSSYTFHMELMKECQAGFRFLRDEQWISANQHANNVDPLPIAQYAWRYFTLIYLRSFHHNSLTKEWSTLWLNLFTIKNEEEASVFPFENILPLATWILEECVHVKPEPKSSASSSTPASTATASSPSPSTSKVSVVDDMCPLPPSKLGSKMRASDDLASSAPSSKSLKRSRADDTEMTSMDDSRLNTTWTDLTGDDDDSYAHTMPPFDAPNSHLFQYLISCPEIDIRDTTFDLFSNISLLFIKYQSLHRETTLAPILEKLVDHLCTFIPFLPYYANKSLILYLRLVHHLCRESQLVLNRFLLKTDTVNNHLLGRLLDMFVGGVTPKENPCGNSVNQMTLASATARRYYPIVKETLSDRTQWKRTYWLLLSLLVSHSDTTPLCEASNNKPLQSDTNEKKEDSAEAKNSSSGMQDIPLDEVKTSDQSPDLNVSPPSDQPNLVKRRSSIGSNASSTDGLEFDAPVPLSTACVEFFLFSPFLDSILTESFNVARMPAISQMMVSLCNNNYQYSLRLVQALFHALQHSDSNSAYYTLIRALLDMKDMFREKRIEAIMSHWLRLFETDQMYWNPMDSSLNYLLTLLLKNEELVQWMHLHCKEWVWLIEWLQNNRVKPSIYQSDTSAVQLDRPKASGSRSSLYRSGSTLDDAWRTGSTWERPSFHNRPLSEFSNSQNPFGEDSSMRSVMDDEDENESTEMEDIGHSMFTPRPHRPNSLANRKNARKNLTAGVMLTATKFTIKEKWKLLCRLRDGTELIADEAPEETAAVQAAIGDPAPASSNFAASSSSSSSSARTNTLLDHDYWDISNVRSDVARAAERVLNGSADRGSASGDEDDDFMRGEGDIQADIESGFALASSGIGASRPQHMIYSKGMPVDAKYIGGPYGSCWKPAVIVAVEEKRIKVHYTDDESISDEWITNIDKRIAARNTMTIQSTDMYQ